MRIAILLPSLQKKGPVILAFDLCKNLIDKVERIDVFYFSECSDPFFLGLNNVNFFKLSFIRPFSFVDYDVVHCHSMRPDFYTYIFKRKIRCSVITTVHNYVYEELSYTYNHLISICFSRIWVRTWSNKDAVVFLSDNMKEYYQSKVGIIKNSRIINNGRHVDEVKSNNETFILSNLLREKKKRYTIIGGCGVLNKRKGFEDIIKFLSFNTNLFAVFIGQGPDKKRLTCLAKNLGVIDRCIFLGYQENASSVIKLLDVFVMSSYSEGFPLVVLEAGSLSVPIICVRSPLFDELFSDNDVVFYERNDLTSMEFALNHMLLNRLRYSNSINKIVGMKYSCKIMAERYLEQYISLNSK